MIVGAHYYDNGETNEGRAFVYYGSTSGLSASANWTAESDQANAYFGYSVVSAGDINGDSYTDVIVGAPFYDDGETDEGRVFVYYGSTSGLSASANWTAESDQANAYFGYSVASAGDVNGDGYADVIVGARNYDNGETDEGRAFVYYGSASGLSASANWTAEADQANAYFGYSVASAGDVNGDGYADVIVGVRNYDNGETDEGRAFVYYGLPNTYIISYDGNGNTSGTAPASQNKTHGIDLTLRSNTGSLAKTGYTFSGWNTSPDGSGSHYDEAGIFNTEADTTLYAEWTLNTTTNNNNNNSGGGGLPAEAFNPPSIPIGGFNVIINQDTKITENRNVNLTFNAGNDVAKMAISLTGDFTDAFIEDYSQNKQIDLCSKFGGLIKQSSCPDGEYTVYVKFYTIWGHPSVIVSQKIKLVNNSQSLETIKSNLVFTKNLCLGMQDSQVKLLQEFLNKNSFILTKNGLGAPGNETNYFGLLTLKALAKFQKTNEEKSNGLIKENGCLGEKTREFINEIIKRDQPLIENKETSSSSMSYIFRRNLFKGMKSEEIKQLQKLLATDREIYPEGLITGYFGTLTQKAVQKFQLKYNIINSESDSGFGVVESKTRAKLAEIFSR